MKATIFLFSAVFLTAIVSGQEKAARNITSGKITYEIRAKLDIKLEGDAARFSESLPKEQVTSKILIFNSDYSLYQPDETSKPDNVLTQSNGQVNVKMVVSGGNDKTFFDLKKMKKVEQKEFMTRMFLIEGDLKATDWKFTGAFKSVAGYNCQEAVKQEKDRKISAWFTSEIPVSSGPSAFGGLPGMVLMVDINDGKQTITAISIDPGFNVKESIIMPKEGKKVTEEEYKKIVDEKLKEMGGEGGDGGHVMIRIKA